MNLSDSLSNTLSGIFKTIPPSQAMTQLVVTEGASAGIVKVVETALKESAMKKNPALASGLWLYVDELDRSHGISQGIDGPPLTYWVRTITTGPAGPECCVS